MTAQPRNDGETAEKNGLSEIGKQVYEPAMKAAACSCAELASLAGRRAQAYMELPARIGACCSPQDVVAEQARFAQAAFAHYSESYGRMLAAYQQLMPQAAGVLEMWQSALKLPAVSLEPSRVERDYLRTENDEREPRRSAPRRAA